MKKHVSSPSVQVPEHPEIHREFAMQFTSTRRGARLARRLVSERLDSWGHPYACGVNETLTLITGELTSNAVCHGHVPGRNFHVRLSAGARGGGETLRVEVADTSGVLPPTEACADAPPADAETGRGLYLVSLFADRWGVTPRTDAPGKRVWAELYVTSTT